MKQENRKSMESANKKLKKPKNRGAKKQENKKSKTLAVALSLIFGLIMMLGIGSIYDPLARAQVRPDSSLVIIPGRGTCSDGTQPGVDNLAPDIGGEFPFFIFPPASTIRYLGASSVKYKSYACMQCHFASDECPNAPKLSADHAHHPMGRSWAKTSCAARGCHPNKILYNQKGVGTLFELDGITVDADGKETPAPFDQQIFSCTSCHGSHTTPIDGNPSFLLHASFRDDDTAFCEYCHHDNKHQKNRTLLAANGGRHFKTKNDSKNRIYRTFKATSTRSENKVKCGGCMFCHFIHQNEKDDPRVIPTISPTRADIKSLMRIPPRELNWGYQGDIVLNKDPLDRYEALCYGCHGNKTIVGEAVTGSLLNPQKWQSHRFACKVATSTNTINNVGRPGKFPLADGTPGAGPGMVS